MARNITGFRFLWDDEQCQMENFDSFVKPFLAKIKVEQTGELLEFRANDIGKVIKLQTPIKIDKTCYRPFGDDFRVHLLDRTEESGYFFEVSLTLNKFFKKEGTVPTIVIWFQGPFFAVSSYDNT